MHRVGYIYDGETITNDTAIDGDVYVSGYLEINACSLLVYGNLYQDREIICNDASIEIKENLYQGYNIRVENTKIEVKVIM